MSQPRARAWMSGAKDPLKARVLPVVLVAAACWLAFAGLRLYAFEGDPSAFIVAGGDLVDESQTPDNVLVHPDTYGYDGQYFYRLARDPLSSERIEFGVPLDEPAYRQNRIGYPVAVWLASMGGRESLVPAMMLVINLVAMLVIAFLGALLARDFNRSPWWALIPAGWAGYVIGVGQNLSEPLAGAFLLAAVLALRRRRWAWVAVALSLAALTRETTLVLAIALVMVGPRRWVGAFPIAVYLAWRLFVSAQWELGGGDASSAGGGPPFTIPFAHLVAHVMWAVRFEDIPSPTITPLPLNLLILALTAAALVVCALGVLKQRVTDDAEEKRGATNSFIVSTWHTVFGSWSPALTVAFFGHLALYLLTTSNWIREEVFLRSACEPILLGWVLLLPSARRILTTLATATLALWLIMVALEYDYAGHLHLTAEADRQECCADE